MNIIFNTIIKDSVIEKVCNQLIEDLVPESVSVILEENVVRKVKYDGCHQSLMSKNVDIIPREKLMSNKYSNEDLQNCIPIDTQLLDSMSRFESIILAQLQRTTRGDFSYSTLQSVYLNHLRYFNDLLINSKADVFVFFNVPHEGYDYIAYCLCQIKGIKILMPIYSPFPGYYFSKSIEQPLLDVNKILHDYKEEYKEKDVAEITLKPYLQEILDEYFLSKEVTPFYMKKKVSVWKKIAGILLLVKKSIISAFDGSLIKKSKIYISRYIKAKKRYKKIARFIKKCSLKNIDYKIPYIYVPLHFQPEMTSNPLGYRYENQLLVIQMLSKFVGKEMIIYVKEHPAQKLSDYRTLRFYEEIAKLCNVKIVPTTTSTADLLNNSVAIATLTGTVAWEAMYKFKPVLMFGEYIYKFAPNVFCIKNNDDCVAAIKELSRFTMTQKDIKIYLQMLDKITYKGYFDEDYMYVSRLTPEENYLAMLQAYTESLNLLLGRTSNEHNNILSTHQ